MKDFDIGRDICICDPTWISFFELEVKRFSSTKGAKIQTYLSNFIRECSKKYLERKNPVGYVIDLLKIKVATLFSGKKI